MYPGKRVIHLFVVVDNARYRHAKLVQAWLARPDSRIKLHFIPTYCPHPDPIERLWGSMHKHISHNQCHPTVADFKAVVRTFLRKEVSRNGIPVVIKYRTIPVSSCQGFSGSGLGRVSICAGFIRPRISSKPANAGLAGTSAGLAGNCIHHLCRSAHPL